MAPPSNQPPPTREDLQPKPGSGANFRESRNFNPVYTRNPHTHTPSGQIDRLPSPPFYKFAIIIANFILTLNAQYNHKRLRARGATANTAHLHNCDATLASVCVLVPPLRVLPSNSRNLLSTKEKKKKTNTLFKVEKNRHFFHSPQITLLRKRCHSHSIAPFTPKAGFARTHFQIREIIKHTGFSVGRREYRSLGHLHSVLNCAWFAAVVVPPILVTGPLSLPTAVAHTEEPWDGERNREELTQ